jgi:hypothetical protein
MIKVFVSAIALVALSSCEQHYAPGEAVSSRNSAAPVQFIAEFEGCQVYRLFDGDSRTPIYVAKCGQEASQTMWHTSHS